MQIQGEVSQHFLSFYDMPRVEDKADQVLQPGMRVMVNMVGDGERDLLSSACDFHL